MSTNIANQQQVDPSKVLGRVSEAFRRLFEQGLNLNDLQTVINDPKLRKRLVRYWKSNGYQPSTNQQVARYIMGENFLGIEEVTQYFGHRFTNKELLQLEEIPFTMEKLEECKDNYILFPGFDLENNRDLKLKIDQTMGFRTESYSRNPGNPLIEKDSSLITPSQSFYKKEGVCLRWYLIRKEVIPESIDKKTYPEMIKTIPDDEESPNITELTYITSLFFLARKVKIFSNNSVVTKYSKIHDGVNYVRLFFPEDENYISFWDIVCEHDISSGIVDSKKLGGYDENNR